MKSIIIFLLAISLVLGCESSSKTVTKETTATPTTQTVVVEKETHVKGHDDVGIFGGVFHVVGEILALPFEIVAGLFRVIF